MLNPVTREPRSAILQKHIAYYYFMQTDNDRFASRYYAFPHTYTVFNIHRGAIKTLVIIPQMCTEPAALNLLSQYKV